MVDRVGERLHVITVLRGHVRGEEGPHLLGQPAGQQVHVGIDDHDPNLATVRRLGARRVVGLQQVEEPFPGSAERPAGQPCGAEADT